MLNSFWCRGLTSDCDRLSQTAARKKNGSNKLMNRGSYLQIKTFIVYFENTNEGLHSDQLKAEHSFALFRDLQFLKQLYQ